MPTADICEKSSALSSVERAAEVFEKHGDFIRSGIRFRVKDETKAEDLFQDLFLLLVAKPVPQDVQNVEGYLFRVITQTAKDAFRRIDRYQARIRRYAERNVRTIEKCPENVIIEKEETKKMFELIERRLPSYEALAVKLRYGDNCSIEEAAEQMGVKPRSVGRYISAGLEKVRCFLGEKQRSNL
jgi:RNA polymerase sigma factor (sigma-70 family)